MYLILPNTDPAPPLRLDMMLLADAAVAALLLDSSEGVEVAVGVFVAGVCVSETLTRASCP